MIIWLYIYGYGLCNMVSTPKIYNFGKMIKIQKFKIYLPLIFTFWARITNWPTLTYLCPIMAPIYVIALWRGIIQEWFFDLFLKSLCPINQVQLHFQLFVLQNVSITFSSTNNIINIDFIFKFQLDHQGFKLLVIFLYNIIH
jgi:hypothetical protein